MIFNRGKWLPHPTLSLLLFLSWLVLMGSVSGGVMVLGFLLAGIIPLLTRVFWPDVPKVSSSLKLTRYLIMVLGDIVVANLIALHLILGPKKNLQPAWIEIPLDIRDPFAVTILASTISLTPGTVSAEVGPGHSKLLIHALNASDPQKVVRDIKQRYEVPLKEIFE